MSCTEHRNLIGNPIESHIRCETEPPTTPSHKLHMHAPYLGQPYPHPSPSDQALTERLHGNVSFPRLGFVFEWAHNAVMHSNRHTIPAWYLSWGIE
ncbi:hypothetical protein KC19_7G162000 [Ceratodon purpureus]|uniref:Uncharacterized protein n=1 Tax=Ceratodon purpureus TaxID=3225 RepID=A0A8T0H799_CERPU|nr:hypothetical protein KC19_7G162000 [Ceratodon purpureus]